MSKVFSCGEAATLLGVHRDKIQSGIRAGAPDASLRSAGRRLFTPADVAALRRWFMSRGHNVNDFDEREYEEKEVAAHA